MEHPLSGLWPDKEQENREIDNQIDQAETIVVSPADAEYEQEKQKRERGIWRMEESNRYLVDSMMGWLESPDSDPALEKRIAQDTDLMQAIQSMGDTLVHLRLISREQRDRKLGRLTDTASH